METAASETSRESCSDLQTYIDTLETPASCNSGEPGILVWTPDENTPDLVYYQVYHLILFVLKYHLLGLKISKLHFLQILEKMMIESMNLI